MKCLTCGNELTTADSPYGSQCRQCERAVASGNQTGAGMSETPKTAFYDLWKHMNDSHCLTLVDSELDEIVRLAAVELTARVAELERELAAVKAERDRAVARLDDLCVQSTRITAGWISVPEVEWDAIFEPMRKPKVDGAGGGKDKPRRMKGCKNKRSAHECDICPHANEHESDLYCGNRVNNCPACIPVDGAGKDGGQ